MTGWEALLLQGIHYASAQPRLRGFRDDLLRNLAGNAFNGFCTAAVQIVKEACLAKLRDAERATDVQQSDAVGGLFDFEFEE